MMHRIISFILTLLIISGFSANVFASVPENQSKNTEIKIAVVVNLSEKEDEGGKNPLLSMLLSFFIPGLGQVYNGEYLKGIGLFTGITALVFFDFLVVEPAVTNSINNKNQNSLLGIAALLVRVGIPVLWVYNWGSAYQSIDPVYQKKLREEKLKKEKEQNENISDNIIQIPLLSLKF